VIYSIVQLQDLLSLTHIFEDFDNLVVNKDNSWVPYNHHDDNCVKMQDRDWFLNARDPEHDPQYFTLGIIIYTDKTGKGAVNPHMGWSHLFLH
jgi:hypothetical protein